MHALALETSGRTGSVALARDGAVVDERAYPHGLKHATALVPLIDALLRDHGLGPGDLATLYVSVGPGSFTGLRVGVTLAKTLAYATGARLVAVPSLGVRVENVEPRAVRHAIVALDAKRGQVFCATYTASDDAWIEAEAPALRRLDEAVARAPRPLALLGELTPADVARWSAEPSVEWLGDLPGRAASVAKLGALRAAQGTFVDPFALVPLYVRLPEAEEKRLVAEGKMTSPLEAPPDAPR